MEREYILYIIFTQWPKTDITCFKDGIVFADVSSVPMFSLEPFILSHSAEKNCWILHVWSISAKQIVAVGCYKIYSNATLKQVHLETRKYEFYLSYNIVWISGHGILQYGKKLAHYFKPRALIEVELSTKSYPDGKLLTASWGPSFRLSEFICVLFRIGGLYLFTYQQLISWYIAFTAIVNFGTITF